MTSVLYRSRVFRHDGSEPRRSALVQGETEEIYFGHKEGNFLAFTIKLSQPYGQHVKAFLLGKYREQNSWDFCGVWNNGRADGHSGSRRP